MVAMSGVCDLITCLFFCYLMELSRDLGLKLDRLYFVNSRLVLHRHWLHVHKEVNFLRFSEMILSCQDAQFPHGCDAFRNVLWFYYSGTPPVGGTTSVHFKQRNTNICVLRRNVENAQG